MNRLAQIFRKSRHRVIGLMSGMSMDGVNLACVDIDGAFPDLAVSIVGHHYRPYPNGFADRLRTIAAVAALSEMNLLVAEEFAQCVNEFLKERNLDPRDIDFIGSHGQTVHHSTEGSNQRSHTLQIGPPSAIAELTGIVTVGNFRIRDIVAGGQGAPLVSLADYVLFHKEDQTVALNNLGSISNVTVVTPGIENVSAFDTGPANMAIDYFARLAPDNQDGIDRDGQLSNGGKVIVPLLDRLMKLPFFARTPPKAAGYAEFGPAVLTEISAPFVGTSAVRDLVMTGVEFCARSLAEAYQRFVIPAHPELKWVGLSGGGVHNPTLVRRIVENLRPLQVETISSSLADWKEAIAFALLANETIAGRPGNLPRVTGARRGVVLGEVAF